MEAASTGINFNADAATLTQCPVVLSRHYVPWSIIGIYIVRNWVAGRGFDYNETVGVNRDPRGATSEDGGAVPCRSAKNQAWEKCLLWVTWLNCL